jgi:hypothetical protein
VATSSPTRRLGTTAAWPLVARAQQPAVPVIGYLSGRSSESDMAMLVAVRRGLEEVGYVKAETWRSNIASLTANSTACRRQIRALVLGFTTLLDLDRIVSLA